jgi:hypothetical protein
MNRINFREAVQIAVRIAAWLGEHRGVPAPVGGMRTPPMYRYVYRVRRRRWALHVIAAGWALVRVAMLRRVAGARALPSG